MKRADIKDFHVYLSRELADKLEKLAASECRSVSQQIAYLTTQALKKANQKWAGDMMDLLKERDTLLARNKKLAEALHGTVKLIEEIDWTAFSVADRNTLLAAKKALAENKEQADDSK
jgi:hypothetical protein